MICRNFFHLVEGEVAPSVYGVHALLQSISQQSNTIQSLQRIEGSAHMLHSILPKIFTTNCLALFTNIKVIQEILKLCYLYISLDSAPLLLSNSVSLVSTKLS